MIGTVECLPSSRRPWPRLRDLLVAVAVGCFAATAAAQEPVANGEAGDRPLTFMRVHVPRGAIADVPLGNERYVPMSLREFEQAIARPEAGQTAPGAVAPDLPLVADAARYEATIGFDGAIIGTLEFEISGGFPGEMPLGTLGVTRAEAVTAAGTGEVDVFGRGDGSFAIPVAQPGTYRCVWSAAAGGGMADTFSLPLVSAVRSTVTLRLPAGVRPLVSGARASPAPVDPASVDPRDRPNAWRIEVGPARSIDVMLVAADRDSPGLAVWTDVLIRGRQSLLSAKVKPASAWTEDVLELEKDASLDVVRVFVPEGEVAGAEAPAARELIWSESADRTVVSVTLPATAAGTMQSVVVEAVAPFAGAATPTDLAFSLPLVRAPRPRWAGGGMVLRLDPDLSLTKIEFDECLAVTPEAASNWPLATLRAGETAAAAAVRQPTVNVEQQGPRAEVRAAVAPRNPEWDVARVTTIDIAPAVVLGRAACDIRVLRGEAFDVKGRVAPGWIIDSVEAVEWPQPGDRIAPPRRRAAPSAGEPVEWKVVRDGSQATLRIGLTVAATPASGLGLLITGHRAGVPLDASFSGADIDMVSLEGESADQSIIAFKTNPDATVEPVTGRFLEEPLAPRLAALAEDGAARGWTSTGARLPAWEARLVRRRPPLDAQVQVRLTARDDRLTESFTFECRPDTSELDALVVQFSEPMDGLLEWSLLPPATGTVTARRIESAPSGRRDAANTTAVAESWLVEIAPPVSEPLTVRAIRTVPFAAPLPVPLAWVEGAVRQVGQMVVRDGGRTRAQVLNRRLGELAPRGVAADGQRGDDVEQLPDTIGEFSFPSSPTAIGSQETVAEIIPGGAGDDSRAWAWSEETRSWCHTSGQTEYETIYDIENHGRSSVTLSLPAGRRLQGILIDGGRLASDDRLDEGTVTIDLPAGRRRLQVIVRSVADAAPGIGFWRVDPSPGVLDLPVLERTWRVLVPPPLDVAVPAACRGAGIESPDWIERLFGARLLKPRASSAGDDGRAGESPAAANASASIIEGFQERVLVPAATGQGGLLVVRTSLLRGLAILAGLGVAIISLGVSRIRGWLPLVLCVITSLTALWIVSPYEMIARAAWWGAVVAWWLNTRWLRTARASVPVATAIMACLALPAACAESPATGPALEPLRVYITPVDGGETALVPEPLFRILVRNGGDPAAAARVMSVDVQASVAADENIPAAAWRLAIDVDADAGAMLVLGQGAAGGRWVAASALINGRPLAVRREAGDRRVRLRLPDAGRHRIEIDVEPAVTRAGDLEYTRIDIPTAPSGTLVIRDSTGGRMAAAPVVCERGPQDGPFTAAPQLAADGDGRTRHDVSRAAAVQLLRAIDGRTAIVGLVRSAESRNDVFWDLDACRVNAVYEIDVGDEILPSVVVAADPRLALVEPIESGITIRPLGGNRFLVARSLPERGAVRIEIPFRMPLVDPVGAFDLPQAWLEGVAVDRRTTRLLPSPSLAVQVSLPATAVTLPPRENDPALQTHAWFTEHVHAATVAEGGPTLAAAPTLPGTGRLHRARVTTERRRQALPGTQNLSVRLFEAQTRLDLEARIDASSAALVVVPVDVPRGSVIDRLSLFEESLQPLDPVDRGAIDVRWTRTAGDRVVVVMQQPRAGRFRLEVAAHLPVAPAREGKLPLVRAVLDDSVPMTVSWNSAAGSTILDRSAELFADERPPAYVLDEQPAGDAAVTPAPAQGRPADGAGAAEADAAILAASESKGPRVELADIEFNVEERGRAWGLARFEMLGQDPLVRLRLPPGMRLFDAFVDGHALVPGVPSLSGQANEWELRLHDVRWPRSLVVVFAGELGGRLAEGAPVELPAPSIVGLPCTRVLWTLNAPRGLTLRVAEPAIVVDAAMVAAERKAAIGRLEADFDRAIAASPGPEQERLREFFGSRWEEPAADGLWPKAVAAIANARGATAATHVIMNPAVGELTIRGVRPSDPSVPGRAITTLATLALGGAALRLARRGPLDWARAGRWFFPGIAATLGVAWLVTLSPSWPGGLLLGYAIAAAARELLWPNSDRTAAERVANDDDTVTQLVVNPAATRESSVTQIAPSRGK
jgi:hypothetical protein